MCRTNGKEDDDEPTYEQALAAAAPGAKTFSVRVCKLRRTHHVVIKNRPVKIVDHATSRTACHGSKTYIVGFDIFTGKKLEEIADTTSRITAPILSHAEYTLLDINPPTLALLTDSGTSKDDVDLPRFPAGLAASLQAAFARGAEIRVQTVTALGGEGVVAFTEESEEAAE
ncbi:eukaryotic translation initiation factor 5A [Mycena latifolia]|nr:eukaryotic translation initiation factor 5A [Mycena latifolia]